MNCLRSGSPYWSPISITKGKQKKKKKKITKKEKEEVPERERERERERREEKKGAVDSDHVAQGKLDFVLQRPWPHLSLCPQ